MNHSPPPPSNDWLIQLPISQLVALQSLLPEVEKLRAENKALLARVDGLHRTLFDTMQLVSELRSSINLAARRPA